MKPFKQFVTESVTFHNDSLIKPDKQYYKFSLPTYDELKDPATYIQWRYNIEIGGFSNLVILGSKIKDWLDIPYKNNANAIDIVFRLPFHGYDGAVECKTQSRRSLTLLQSFFFCEADAISETPNEKSYNEILYWLNQSLHTRYNNWQLSTQFAAIHINSRKAERDALRNTHNLKIDF